MFNIEIKGVSYDLLSLDQYGGMRRRMSKFHEDCAVVASDLQEQVRHQTLAVSDLEHAMVIESITIDGMKPHTYISELRKVVFTAEQTQAMLCGKINELQRRVEELERILVNVDRLGDAHIH